jgi:serine/threonine protein kinase
MRLCGVESNGEGEATVIETRQILEELPLKDVLATSATGAVFLAVDPATDGEVVIKVVSCGVPGAEDEIRRLFLETVEAARSLKIQSMPTLIDHGLTPEGDGFVVMEVVEGQTLDTFEEVTAYRAVNLLLDVLACIEDLARAGSAHLNLKPANILVTGGAHDGRATVLGFGTSATLLHAGDGVPVPAADPHLAPELVAGKLLPNEQAWRSDLFSLGVVACEVLGAEIEADGYERPRVSIPAAVAAELPEIEPLEKMLGRIMDPDPMQRGDDPSQVRDPLIRALPDPPAAAAFDPNKTDPALVTARGTEMPSDAEPPPAATPASPPQEAEVDDPVSASLRDDPPDGWPEVLFDDPVTPASLTDTEDTDVRNPVPEDVWVPPADNPEAVEGVPAPVPAAAAARRGVRRVSRLEVIAVAAVVVVLGTIIALTWPKAANGGGKTANFAVEAPVGEPDPLVPPPVDENLFDDLLAVQRLVDDGDLDAARAALDALDSRDDVSFDSDESALYDSLVTAVAQAADRGAAIADLQDGLAYGSIRMIRRGVAGLAGISPVERDEVDGLAEELARGRRVLQLHSEMWDASRDGDHLGAIRAAGRLFEELPGYSGAAEVREESALALESRAESYAARGEFSNAVAVYQSLLQVEPNRPGVDSRIAWCRDRISSIENDEARIAAIADRGEQGDPEGALAALDGLDVDPRFDAELERLRGTLNDALAAMDADTPVVELATSEALGFKKNQTVVVPLRVSDDYRVERVVVHARNEKDDGYLEIDLAPAGDGLYHFSVTPELHGNTNVYFFVVAVDHSGHVGRLGSETSPQLVERKKWFKKLG